MVTFAAATKNSSSFPTRAPGQRRVDHFVANTCSVPNDWCDLYSDDCRSYAQLVSPSRDPSRYADGNLLYCGYFVPSFTDPAGRIVKKDHREEWTYDEYWWWYWNNVTPFYDGYFASSHGGCIGLVRSLGRKSKLFEGTKCFYFPGDQARTEKAAQDALKKLDCANKFMFAFNSWTNGNNPTHPNHIKSCRQCGHVFSPNLPSEGNPNSPESPNFDFCIKRKNCWMGANHSHTDNSPMTVYIWPDVQTFAGYYGNYDATVICVTCSDDQPVDPGCFGGSCPF